MNRDDALNFLKQHQPMPPEAELTDEQVKTYDDVRRYFVENPDEEAIPLILNSFGEGGARGVYQLVEDVLSRYDRAAVLPHIEGALRSSHESVRYWNAQLAAVFPSERLIVVLAELLNDPSFDIRYSAVAALEQIGSFAAIEVLRAARDRERNSEIRELIDEVVAAMGE